MKISGFTLIEFLVVIAVLAILLGGLLFFISPGEKLAQARDASRKSIVAQLARAMQAYAVSHNGSYVPNVGTWISDLVNTGELKSVPAQIDYAVGTSPCATRVQNNYCYDNNNDYTNVIIYTVLESSTEKKKCTDPAKPVAFILWSSLDGKEGVVCAATVNPWQDPGGGYTYL